MSAWPRARLDECTEIVSGATPKTSEASFWGGEIRWATPKDLSDLDGAYISDTPRKITTGGLKSCAASVLPAQSVLFSSRAPIGLVAVNTVPMATNQGFKSFVPDRRKVDPKYLYWWLRANRPVLEQLGNGATFKEMSKAAVSRVEIDLPPLPEQRRIAAILDAADALRTKRRAAIAKLDELTQSIFLDMFGDPATNPRSLNCAPLGKIANVATGGTPSRSVGGYFGGDIPWVKTTEVNGAVIFETEEKLTPSGLKAIRGKVHPIGSIVIAMYGQGKTRGHTGLLACAAAVNQACAVIHPNAAFESRLLFIQLQLGYERLRSLARGGNQENLNLELVRSFPVLLPDRAQQAAFIHRIDAIARTRQGELRALDAQETLFTSLQQRAFRGEL